MALNIKDPEADALARKLAARTGESLTQAVLNALKERLQRTEHARRSTLVRDIMAIGEHCAALPEIDSRSADDIIGYDENGLPR